jgi:hypothetical protein
MGMALAASASNALAQTWTNPKTFDYSKGSWITWNGWGMQDDGTMLTQDPTLDAMDDPNSGSLRYAFPFTGDSSEQFMTFGTLHDQWGWDSTTIINCIDNYKNMTLDFKLDPATAPTKNGNFGTLQFGLVYMAGTDWKQIKLADYNIPESATNWTHLIFPIDQSATGLNTVTGYYIYLWSGGVFTNTLMFNVDNIYLEPSTNEPPPAPPTMSVEKTQRGLNLIALGDGQYDRQNFRTVNPEYSWVGKGSTPVTYSFTVKSYPGTNNPNFEVHSYLIPVPYDPNVGPGTIDTQSSPDWNQTNCVFMELQNKPNGSAEYTFRWKTNSIPDGNGTYYSSPLAILTETNGPLGTWTLSFVNDTNVTMTSPSGSTTNFEFSVDKLAGYVDINNAPLPLYYYLGMKPQEATNRGLTALISEVKLQGFSANIDDNFMTDSAFDTNLWELAANNAGSVQLMSADNLYWIGWTIPDAGFVLQTNSIVSTNGWNESVVAPLATPSGKKLLISRDNMPDSNQGYYRLIKRAYAKLQVLMPGETNAPGTATGKIGTPTTQNVNVPFDVVVNAVDDTWHLIKLAPNDIITITSDDPAVYIPADAALVAGTRTFTVTFGSEGTFTVTASDTTDTAKTADTGTPTKVDP